MALFGGITIPGRPDPENIRRLDLLPMPAISRMQRVGIAIDKEWLWSLSVQLESRQNELKKEISSFIPESVLTDFLYSSGELDSLNVNSAAQIASLLFQHLHVGSGKRLKTTKDGTRLSTGKKQLETLKRDHPIIPKILEFRECAKLRSTYCEALPKLAKFHSRKDCSVCGLQHNTDHWRIHTEILATRTDTGRLASRRPNLQNIPARSKLGREVRKAFIAETGKRLVSRDYAQIELRWLADRAQEPNMLRIFQEGGDIHLDTAMRAFGITDPKKVDKLMHRAPCKNVNFGIGYGLGAQGLLDLMALTYATANTELPSDIDLGWCESFIQQWFDLYPAAKDYFDLQHFRCRRYGITWCAFGGVRRIPEMRSVYERIRQAGLRQGGNNPIQRGAAGIFKIGLARVHRQLEIIRSYGVGAEALLPVHDEIISEVDEDWADEAAELIGMEMSNALVDEDTGELMSRVPIGTDGCVSDRWTKD